MPDRLARAARLQQVMRIWLVGSPHEVIGAYWPIKGEFDPLPALYRWQEDAVLSPEFQENVSLAQAGQAQLATESIAGRSPRKIGLPVVDKLHKTLTFHAWYPGCPMEEDAYGIPKPKDTEIINPTLLFVPCVGYGPGGYRLGYGGGFYDRTLATLAPRPVTVGLGFSHGWLPDLAPEPHDIALDVLLNDNGVAWPV
ncbi:MAG: 5-formyltetrahydrofolate cyclo-ligase [Polaromonas sp.]|nr:5-formyltetrahydrofolate cyclo-ligase [Polaromonas sp.]